MEATRTCGHTRSMLATRSVVSVYECMVMMFQVSMLRAQVSLLVLVLQTNWCVTQCCVLSVQHFKQLNAKPHRGKTTLTGFHMPASHLFSLEKHPFCERHLGLRHTSHCFMSSLAIIQRPKYFPTTYQHHVELCLRYMLLSLYWECGTIILVVIQAPTKS